MTPEDILYLVLLLFCTVCGSFVRKIKDVQQRQFVCTLIGFSLLLIISGYHILHPVILTVINSIIVLKTSKKCCHIVSFAFCFSYLMLIRMSEYFNIPSPPEVTNTALMIMVLKLVWPPLPFTFCVPPFGNCCCRAIVCSLVHLNYYMVGLAYEVNMHHLRCISTDKSEHLKEMYTRINISFFNIVQYSFCYAGILVGPYYKYRTYEDMLHKPFSMCVPHFSFLKKRIAVVPLYAILYLISDYLFPLSLAASDEIWNYPFLYRLLYMMPWFFSFRMRIYIAFVLGECICINLGLGAYPKSCCSQPGAGPTNFVLLQEIEKNSDSLKVMTYDFESIRCMDEFSSEFRPTIREGIRYWNMTVQYWLAIYIYRKTAASKPVKMFTTMFVSAIWHGVRPGYYLSLLGTPLLLLSEIQVEKAIRKNLTEHSQKVYDFIWYFVKMQSVSYMGIAFILLDFKATIHYWNSIYFIGHFVTVFMFMMAFLKNRFVKKIQRKEKKTFELKDTKSL